MLGFLMEYSGKAAGREQKAKKYMNFWKEKWEVIQPELEDFYSCVSYWLSD